MLAPAVARKARADARFHIQLRVDPVHAPDGFVHGACPISGTVQRSFRGSDGLEPGAPVTFPVHCYVDPEDHPTGPRWLDFAGLKPGTLLEGFLNPAEDGPQLEVALWQVRIIPALTDRPEPASWEPSPAPANWWRRLFRRPK